MSGISVARGKAVKSKTAKASCPASEMAIRRFLKALLRAGHAERDADRFTAAGDGLRAGLDAADADRLASQGLVRIEHGVCRPTQECATWLRRQQAGKGDFASQHRQLVSGPDGSCRDLSGNPLEKLAGISGGFLEPHQVAAGIRVRLWGTRAQLRQRVTMSYDPAQMGGRRQGGGGDIADMAAEARKALARLYADLPRDCAEILLDVCVFEKGLQTIEVERGWPRRSAKLVLRIGLDQLAARLGLSPEAVGKPSGRLQAWLEDGFAPTRFE